jgi:hypothetical protein
MTGIAETPLAWSSWAASALLSSRVHAARRSSMSVRGDLALGDLALGGQGPLARGGRLGPRRARH